MKKALEECQPVVFYNDILRIWKEAKYPFLQTLSRDNLFIFYRDLCMYGDLIPSYEAFQESIRLLPESKCKKELSVFLEDEKPKSFYQNSLIIFFKEEDADWIKV